MIPPPAPTDFGQAIPISQANLHIEKYDTVNRKAGTIIKMALRLIPDSLDAQKFFEAIHVNNAFVFKADLIERFFAQNNPEKPEYFIVCLGGGIENDNEGEATVIVTGCRFDEQNKKYNIVKGVPDPVSEHPAKKAIPHFDDTKSESEQLSFTIK